MIPQIITITEKNTTDVIIAQFAKQKGIDTAQIIVVRPEKDELTVEQIHLLQKDIQYTFTKKVLVVLLGVDESSIEVQNSLLKSLEEDAERIQFLFLVFQHSRLLPTILSRCSVVIDEQPKLPVEQVVSTEETFSFQTNSENTKEEALAKIDAFIQSKKVKDHQLLKLILNMRKLIIDNNLNPILALDNILIFLSKQSTMKVPHEK